MMTSVLKRGQRISFSVHLTIYQVRQGFPYIGDKRIALHPRSIYPLVSPLEGVAPHPSRVDFSE
ncbi:MAG: hypothetical protein HOI21_12890 [Bacteroidetes Order II. Incertae sedis bacterium]|nr:hypothetical protein [Bacteroidetes Order II. bacterium]